MPITLYFISSQLCSIVIFGIAGLVMVWSYQRAFQREIASIHTDSDLLAIYQRFATARVRILLTVRRVTVMILLIACVTAVFAQIYSSESEADFGTPWIFFSLFALVFGIVIGYYFSLNLASYIGSILVDAEAVRVFQISSLQRDDIVALRMRSIFLYLLPGFLLLEIMGSVFVFVNNIYLSFSLLASISVLSLVTRNIFALPLYRLILPLKPLEQSEWAFLAPRIKAWAQLGGIEFSSIHVQQDLIGTANIRLLGLGRPALILSETLLRYTDWRQRDALIALAAGMARKKAVRKAFLNRLFMLLFLAAILLLLPLLILALSAMSLDRLLLTLLFVVILLLVLARITRSSARRSNYLDADRIASFLTGDPIALMVALNTLNTLNGVPTTYTPTRAIPATQRRMQKLDALVHESWPRAPHAAQPVPSIISATFGPFILTQPPANIPDPCPVPSVPYMDLDARIAQRQNRA